MYPFRECTQLAMVGPSVAKAVRQLLEFGLLFFHKPLFHLVRPVFSQTQLLVGYRSRTRGGVAAVHCFRSSSFVVARLGDAAWDGAACPRRRLRGVQLDHEALLHL